MVRIVETGLREQIPAHGALWVDQADYHLTLERLRGGFDRGLKANLRRSAVTVNSVRPHGIAVFLTCSCIRYGLLIVALWSLGSLESMSCKMWR